MGRCQGRMWRGGGRDPGPGHGQPIHLVGRLRAQAPIKPLPMALGLSAALPKER
jgi:hypothetical protein